MQTFSCTLNKRVCIIVATANDNRYFITGGYHFNKCFHFFVYGMHCMAVSNHQFLRVMGIGFYKNPHPLEIEVTQQQNFFSAQKVVALNVEKGRSKRLPDGISSSCSKVCPHTNAFRN